MAITASKPTVREHFRTFSIPCTWFPHKSMLRRSQSIVLPVVTVNFFPTAAKSGYPVAGVERGNFQRFLLFTMFITWL